MKNILVIDSGLKPGWTKKAVDTIVEKLQKENSYQIDRINLREEQINPCIGCALCLNRGEEKCRNHSDSTAKVLEKMIWADGIITVSPNYSLNVPWELKNLYDRLAFVFHRPRLFHKTALAIVVQGVYGGNKIVKYIDELMAFWGCKTVKGTVLSGALFPNSAMDEGRQNKNNTDMDKALLRFQKELKVTKPKHPSLFRLALFRMTRSSMKYSPEVCPADKAYYKENGWFDSKYYYEVGLNPVYSLIGRLIDRMIKNMILKPKKKN